MNLLTKAFPFRNVTIEKFIGVLELLDSNYLIFFDRTKNDFLEKKEDLSNIILKIFYNT